MLKNYENETDEALLSGEKGGREKGVRQRDGARARHGNAKEDKAKDDERKRSFLIKKSVKYI